MKSSVKFAFLAAFLSLFLISFASAITANVISVSPNPSTHNSDVTVTFQVNDTDAFNYTSITTAAGTTVSQGSFTTIASYGTLTQGQSTGPLTAIFHVNQFAAAGTYNPSIKIDGLGGSASTTLTVPITVSSSPAITVTSTPASETKDGTMTLKNTGNAPLSLTLGNSDTSITLSQSSVSLPTPGTSTQTITYHIVDSSTLTFGSTAIPITLSGSGISQTVNVNKEKSFCTSGAAGTNLSITSIDISSSGSDDTTWKPLDTVTVKVEFENNGDTDLKSINIELGIFDSSGNKKTGDLKFTSDGDSKISYGTLKSGDSDSVKFEFQVPADMKESDYKLAVKAYSTKSGQDVICADRVGSELFQPVSVEKETDNNKYIAFDDIVASPTEGTCGDTVTLSYKAYNIGDEDQDRVKFDVLSKDFNFSNSQEVTKFDMGDSVQLNYAFTIPAGMKDKTYNIELNAEYDYNKGIYKQELGSNTIVPFKVFGCAPVSTRFDSVSAQMVSSDAVAGQPLEIKATIANPTTTSASYTVDATGFSSWADSVDPSSTQTFTLAPGASRDITYTFKVNSNAEGDKSFNVEVSSNGKTDSKEIAVTISKPASSLSSLLAGKSALFWIIVAANVILIILIIVVAVRLASR